MAVVGVVFALLAGRHAGAPPLLPPWPPTYDMQSSTILQPSNPDGWLPADLARWGIVDIDWENSRAYVHPPL